MGGKSRKRRLANFNRAKEEKAGRHTLPPAEVFKKGHKSQDNLPASLRKMMSVKAAAERQVGSPSRRRRTNTGPGVRNKFKKEVPGSAGAPSAAGAGAIGSKGSTMGVSPHNRGDSETAGPSGRDALTVTVLDNLEETEGKKVEHLVSNKSLKPQKKEFLKHRKLKCKGKLRTASGKGEESDLEAQIMTDRHKPAFGEQALQPIKVNLKRKHWDAERKSKARLKEVFQKQMAMAIEDARQREASKGALAEAYRVQKRRRSGGQPAAATPASLASLVKRNAAMDDAR